MAVRKRHGSQQSRRRRTARRAATLAAAAPSPVATLDESTAAAFAALGAAASLPASPTRRERVMAALTASGVELAPSYDLAFGSWAEQRFYALAFQGGLTEASATEWPFEGELVDVGTVELRDGDTGIYRLGDGTVVLAHCGHGWFRLRVASTSREALSEVHAAFVAQYPPLFAESSEGDGLVPITFWTDGRFGPTSRLRRIEAAPWENVARNYTGEVAAELARLVGPDFEPGAGGQLHLWQGPPGTGKTHALRALAHEWRSWAEFHYITDPDAFFVANPSYMIDVLLAESYEELAINSDGGTDVLTSVDPGGKWRVLILEDTGELLSANAKEQYGQGLSRLLNVVDGMVGQGLRVLAVLTTNDELGELHPAAIRPGRCASRIEFGALSADEARLWLLGRGDSSTAVNVDGPLTLAELYAVDASGEPAEFAAPMPCDNCDHAYADHLGEEGPCAMEDCGCEGYVSPDDSEDASVQAAGTVILRQADGQERVLGILPETFDTDGVVRFTLEEFVTLDEAVPAAVDERPPVVPASDQPVRASMKRWRATLVPEGTLTDDGRMFAEGSVSWRELPLSLMAQLETQPGHDGAIVCGRIDNIYREGSLILAEGVFDDGEFGQEVARMVDERVLRGISVDVAIRQYEVAYRSEIEGGTTAEESEEAEPSLLDILFSDEPTVMIVTDGVIGAVTICSFPAFADAEISLVASGARWTYTHQGSIVITGEPFLDAVVAAVSGVPGSISPRVVREPFLCEFVPTGASGPTGPTGMSGSLLAAAPVRPPAAWFEGPELVELTPLVVTAEGRIYGHLAAWGTCHIGIPDVCTTAPHSEVSYAYFHNGALELDDGEQIAVGKITLGTGHADPKLGWQAALAHYDNTGTVAGDIIAGEDEFGIWVAGAVRPSLDAEQVRELRAAPLSGDWRNINGNLEMIAALAVNTPGFPIPRPRAIVAAIESGQRVLSLTAAGLVLSEDLFTPEEREKLAAIRELGTAHRFAEIAAAVKAR